MISTFLMGTARSFATSRNFHIFDGDKSIIWIAWAIFCSKLYQIVLLSVVEYRRSQLVAEVEDGQYKTWAATTIQSKLVESMSTKGQMKQAPRDNNSASGSREQPKQGHKHTFVSSFLTDLIRLICKF